MQGKFTNMMAIMLDPCFKALHIVENLVGHMTAFQVAYEYDVKVVVPLLMVCFDMLNLDVGTFVMQQLML
jgi:hypothetical protein